MWLMGSCLQWLALLLACSLPTASKPSTSGGRTANRMSGACRGEAKTDARDAVIAETSRQRRDFSTIDVPAQPAADLALLTAHRSDLVADRVRMINRLRDVLTGVFPALERAFDHSSQKGALILLTGYQSQAAIRRRGRARLTAWLANRGVRGADTVAATSLQAAQAQQTSLPGEEVAAQLVADLAAQILAPDDRLKRLDKQIRETLRSHPQAEIIGSLPGLGPIPGAEFVVAAGDLTACADAGHLASAAGLVPIPRDCGRRTGDLHRPKRYSRRPRRMFYMSAQTSIIRDGPNRDFHLKKRGEGCQHVQAVIALARRRARCGPCCVTDESSPPPNRSRRRHDFTIETPGTGRGAGAVRGRGRSRGAPGLGGAGVRAGAVQLARKARRSALNAFSKSPTRPCGAPG
ncbi:Transposase IS116/IS110/IS902 family protein [Streptomyces sp. ADI95-16]|nr:Transposase IS116/IS110/IS902 family protein [Streptomyces sp. ADI95-16]